MVRSWLAGHKKAVISIIGLLLVLLILVVASLFLQPKSMPSVSQNTPSPTATLTPTPTIDPAENQYFAALPQTMLYYSFAQTSTSRNVYQSDITDTHRRNVDIGFPGSYQFLTSPDGRWLLRYNDHQLDRAQSDNPTKFTTIYKWPNQQSRLTSIIFATDSSQIALDLTQNSRAVAGQPYYTNALTIISNTAQPQATVLFNTDKPFRYQLVGFNAKQQIWYIENRDGRLSNLTRLNLNTGKSDAPLTSFNQNGLLDQLQFNRDVTYAYAVSDTYVTEYAVASQQSRVIYSFDNSCPQKGKTNGSAISGFTVAPTAPQLLVAINLQTCSGQPKPTAGALPPATQRTLLINTKNGQIIRQQDNLPIAKITEAAWAPTNQQVWLTVDATTHYELEAGSLDIHPIPSLDRQTLTKEKLYLLGWLAPFKAQ
jgi:hypothetical protein